MDSRIHQPSIRGFMDDLTVTTTNHIQCTGKMGPISTGRGRFLGTYEVQSKEIKISGTEEGARGQESQRQIQGEEILSIVGNPIKWFNESLRQTRGASWTQRRSSLLKTVDGSGLPGKNKA